MYSVPSEAAKAAMNDADLTEPANQVMAVKARLNNVGAVFKGVTFGLFNVPRDDEAAKAVRTEATLLAMRRTGELLDYPEIARFEHSLTNAKILQHGMLTEITSSMPELEARVQGDVAGSSWQDEVYRDYEDAAEDVVAEIVG